MNIAYFFKIPIKALHDTVIGYLSTLTEEFHQIYVQSLQIKMEDDLEKLFIAVSKQKGCKQERGCKHRDK